MSETEEKVVKHQNNRVVAKRRHAHKRSTSDTVTRTRDGSESSHKAPAKPVHSEKGRPGKHAKSRLRNTGSTYVPRPTAPRASSSSQLELRSRYHNPSFPAANLQRELRELVARSEHITPYPIRPEPAENIRGKDNRWHDFNVENSAPTFRWYARAQSSPESDVSKRLTPPKLHSPESPLKPCLKTKAKSTTTSPPAEPQKPADTDAGKKSLRRVKTVDFEEARKPLLALSASRGSKQPVHKPIGQPKTPPTGVLKTARSASGAPCFPTMLGTTKSNLADPATTHTAVHVIAIAPSRKANTAVDKPTNDPATPTMQVVESNSGCYEVIWDDVPVDQSGRDRRRSSSASHSLQQLNPTATRGLQRINSKLADWSGSWNAPSESFKPTIVVFPDDDARAPHFECAVEDEEDLLAPAPPNSHNTSALQSHVTSRPASAPLTRTPSADEVPRVGASQGDPTEVKEGWVVPLEDALLVPDPEMQSTRILNATHRMRNIPVVRKLSDVDDADLKFRGHRDSVTLAHTRLLHSGGLGLELFAHRDSVSMARKRMHGRNHAISTIRNKTGPNSME
jgi:hypothetical protein